MTTSKSPFTEAQLHEIAVIAIKFGVPELQNPEQKGIYLDGKTKVIINPRVMSSKFRGMPIVGIYEAGEADEIDSGIFDDIRTAISDAFKRIKPKYVPKEVHDSKTQGDNYNGIPIVVTDSVTSPILVDKELIKEAIKNEPEKQEVKEPAKPKMTDKEISDAIEAAQTKKAKEPEVKPKENKMKEETGLQKKGDNTPAKKSDHELDLEINRAKAKEVP